jgi:hypothetical protein
VDALLIKVANFSESAVWVVGSLFVLEFVALFYFVYRAGKRGKEEGRVVTEQMRGRSGPLIGWRYWSKRRVLASRSAYISEMSLVDGTATKAERLIAHGIKLAFLLFWLAFVLGILTLLPSEPGLALSMLLLMCCALYYGVTLIRRSRADALRKLAEKQAPPKT